MVKSLDEVIERLQYKADNIKAKLDPSYFTECIDYLKEYRDAEEQGLLLRLPCKVGDTVYCRIDEDNNLEPYETHIYTSKVEKYSIKEVHGENLLMIHLGFWDTDINPRTEVQFIDNVLNKSVFLTKEEAEQNLAEMRGDVK